VAPLAPLGKARLLELLGQGTLPLRFGSPHPCTMVLQEDGVFRMRELVVDAEESRKAGQAAIRAGQGWMPEHHFALAKPTGRIYLEAKTLDELREKIEAFKWPKHW
jgi:hypothetical protein